MTRRLAIGVAAGLTVAALAGPAAADESDLLFVETGPPLEIALEVAPDDWSWLQANATLEAWVPADVTVGGETFSGAGLRFKGSWNSLYSCFDGDGNQLCPKLSLKVGFDEYQPGARHLGVRTLVLNSCNRDPTCLRERLAYELFRRAGVVAGRTRHVSVRVNGGLPSLYLLVEHVDEAYLEHHFEDPTGNLYKEVWPQHTEPGPYLDALRTNEDGGDVSGMTAFAAWLEGASEDDLASGLGDHVDVEALARWLAVDVLVDDWDGPRTFFCTGEVCTNHNLYLYEDPASGHIALLPWDLDHTSERPGTDLGRAWLDTSDDACAIVAANPFVGLRAPQCDPLMRGILVHGWSRYLDALDTLTAPGGPLDAATQLGLLAEWRAAIGPLVEADPLGPGHDLWRREVAQLRQIVRAQRAEIETLLAEH